MCEFISWIEYKGEEYFLTSKDLRTKEGRALKKYLGIQYWEDIKGHGSIEHYYTFLKGKGVHKECTDFSTPDNFPPAIVEAIKKGQFRGIGVCPDILNQAAWDKYKKIQQPAWDKYKKIQQPAWDKYKKIQQAARDEYNEIQQAAWDEKIQQAARDEYNEIKQAALDEYNKITQAARDEYEKIRQAAWDEYNKIKQTTFWDLAKAAKNRVEAWR